MSRPEQSQSRAFRLDAIDFRKLLRGFVLQNAGLLVGLLTMALSGLDVEHNALGAAVVAAATFGIDVFRRWVRDNGGSIDPVFPRGPRTRAA